MRAILAGLAAVILAVPTLAQDIPDPSLCKVPRSLPVSPDAGIPFLVKIVGASGPIPNLVVQIRIQDSAEPLVCWGTEQILPVITGITDAGGEVTFFVAGGGCVHENNVGDSWLPIAQVFADTVLIAELSVVSPDVVNRAGLLNTDEGFSFDVSGCTVGLADAVFHTNAIFLGLIEGCSKLTDPVDIFHDTVDSADAALLAPYIAQGVSRTSRATGEPNLANSQLQSVIALHGVPRTASPPFNCVVRNLEGASGFSCDEFTSDSLSLGIGHDVYLVVANGNPQWGISALSCGLEFDDDIAVKEWRVCADIDYAGPGWPSTSGSGNRITWASRSNCQNTTLDSHGVHAVAGAFYVYAYGDGELRITPNGVPQSGPELLVADCRGRESEIADGAAVVGFGSRRGRNPCLLPTAVKTTSWGRIKATYKYSFKSRPRSPEALPSPPYRNVWSAPSSCSPPSPRTPPCVSL